MMRLLGGEAPRPSNTGGSKYMRGIVTLSNLAYLLGHQTRKREGCRHV